MIEGEVSAGLTIRLLGPFQGFVAGEPFPALRSRKAFWALSLLVLRAGRPMPREWLAGTLWPEVGREGALANLRPVISDLRRVLGKESPRLRSLDRRTLQFEVDGAEIDVVEFDRLVKSERREDLARAVALYGGPLLAGCSDEWAEPERDSREQGCLQAVLRLGDLAMASGEFAEAGGFYLRAIGLDPWRDASRRGLMESLARGGDPNAALHAYREFADFLRRESSAAPGEDISAFYQRLRSECRRPLRLPSPAVASSGGEAKVEGYLPHPLTEIVGREDERGEVEELLRSARLVTLTGTGGIGKTRLAITVASEMGFDFPDGVWFVGLESLPTGGAIEVQVATVLGRGDSPGREPLEGLKELLRKKRLLLVLDNCEHVLSSCTHVVGELLRECRDLRVLATSREALGILGETVWTVPPLSTPTPEQLPKGIATMQRVLLGYEGVQLFVQRARALDRSFWLTGGNAFLVAQICARLEGIPLAIELAAARTKSLTMERIQQRLDDYLLEGSGAGTTRQGTLRSTIDWSYSLLEEPARLVLMRLSVFVGGWTMEAAEKVAAGGAIEEDSVPDLIGTLIDKSLVLFEAGREDDGRYRLLETVRQYAEEKLTEGGLRDDAEAAHRSWAFEFAARAEPELRGGGQKEWIRKLKGERDNLHAALRSFEQCASGVEEGLRMAGMLWQFWYFSRDYLEGRLRLGKALEREEPGTEALRARAMNGAGALAYDQGDLVAARELFEGSLGLWRTVGDETKAAAVLNNLANVDNDEGNYPSARVRLEESLRIAERAGNLDSAAMALGNLGNVLRLMGEAEGALASYQRSLELHRDLGDLRCVALTMSRVALIRGAQGDYHSARMHHEEAMDLWQELGNTHGAAWTLYGLAEVARNKGERELAEELFRDCEERIRPFNDFRGIAYVCSGWGEVLLEQGDLALASTKFEEAAGHFRTLGDRRGLAYALGGRGSVRCARGEFAGAGECFGESLGIFHDLQDRAAVAHCLGWYADLSFAEGDLRKALVFWGVADADRRRSGAPFHVPEKRRYERQFEAASVLLGGEVAESLRREGEARSLEDAVSEIGWAAVSR